MICTRWSAIGPWSRRLVWLDRRRGELPLNREVEIWLVGAEVAGLDTSREDVSQRGIALRDSVQYRLDGLSDTLAGAFRS